MASAVYSEPPASRLSIALEGEASASPFPSPSSSFLPPPTPGAHEFAVKPAPTTRNGRKLSSPATHISTNGDSTTTARTETSSQRSSVASDQGVNGQLQAPAPSSKENLSPTPSSPALISPTTPTPYTLQHKASMSHLEPPKSPLVEQSTSSSTTPTILTSALPPEEPHAGAVDEHLSKIVIPDNLDEGLISMGGASSPTSPAFSTFSTSSRPLSASLSSSRPAPPSPALSRRVSGVPSLASNRSRPPSQSVSRASSLRKPAGSISARASPVLQPHRLSQSFAPPLSPQNLSFALNVQPTASTSAAASRPASVALATPSAPATARAAKTVFIRVRDYGFAPSDERHFGLGPETPKPNMVRRLNRRLGGRTLSTGSVESSDGDGEEEEQEDDGWGTSGLLGRLSWLGAAAAASGSVSPGFSADEGEREGFPDQSELDMNFRDDEEEEEQLYPGLYRALYAFEPEGIAEMRLEEEQVVRVVGRGGGVGWAVVVDESAVPTEEELAEAARTGVAILPRHALVPEGYLEPIRFDWEDEEAAEAQAAAQATDGAGAADA